MYPGNSRGAPENDPFAPKKKPFGVFGDPSTFTGAATQQGNDYDAIMKQYRDFATNMSNNPLGGNNNPISASPISPGAPIKSDPLSAGRPLDYGKDIVSNPINRPTPIGFNPLTASTAKYEQSGDVTDSLSKLKNLTETGGYSEEDKQNIRERDISPIRSIYASGKQALERQRSLSGGYSPNFNAVSAKMARDQADKIGGIVTSANAGIAQDVAHNKLAAATPYAGYSGQANAAKTAADQRNSDIINEINKYNSSTKLNTDEFNTTTSLGVDKYNRDTQLGLDLNNRDTRLNTGKYNRDTQLGVDRTNRDTQIGLDTSNRDYRTGVDKSNRDTQLGVDQINSNKNNQDQQARIQAILDSIRGQASLYGTTPALSSLFGNQVIQAGQLGQGQQDLNNRKRSDILRFATRG